MTSETIMLITALLAVVISAYAIYKSKQPLTVKNVTDTLTDAVPLAQELTEVSLTAARASEQLWRSGKIERDERFTHAFAYVDKWFGGVLEEDQIVTALESAVLVTKALVERLPDKPADTVIIAVEDK
jgi:hypothetical protein